MARGFRMPLSPMGGRSPMPRSSPRFGGDRLSGSRTWSAVISLGCSPRPAVMLGSNGRLKAYHKLDTWRGEAPFEHWLMRLAVRTCYDHLRSHQRNREDSSGGEQELDLLATGAEIRPAQGISTDAAAAKTLVDAVLDRLPPAHRLVLTLMELEERSVREIADLTGWSVPLVKVRAFRARAAFRAQLGRMQSSKYL